MSDVLDRGRESPGHQSWGDTYARLVAADLEEPLGPEDLQRLATAAYLTGRDAECADAWTRAHRQFLNRGDPQRAARCAFWLALGLLLRGDMAQGGGWLARAQRLLEEGRLHCVEKGYLLLPVALHCLETGAAETAYATFNEAYNLGVHFGDPDLTTLGRVGLGQALVRMRKTAQAVGLLDEAMVAVTAGEASPLVAGIAYCAVIEACHEAFDLRRAREWTAALTHWCDSQPGLVPYRGQCLVHRAEIMQLHGAWQDAMDEAQRACQWLADNPAGGSAFYQRAELHRLRGEFAEAEEAYRQASRWGRRPEPGLPLLRLAQGQVDAAAAAIRRAVDEAHDLVARSRLLAAYVEIMLAEGDLPSAGGAAQELSGIAADAATPLLHAISDHASGSVHLAQGDVRSALGTLRRAWTAWQELEAPYEAARVRVLIGLACRQLGDEDSAQMELDAARWGFQHLGAAPDLARVDALSQKTPLRAAGGLTARELEVLRLIAAGNGNRAIAAQLFLSENTVHRHVANILNKLSLPSRAAAVAYAVREQLL